MLEVLFASSNHPLHTFKLHTFPEIISLLVYIKIFLFDSSTVTKNSDTKKFARLPWDSLGNKTGFKGKED